jgi:hypothetical protein
MDESTTPGIGGDGTPFAEDSLAIDSQDRGQENTIGTPPKNVLFPPGNKRGIELTTQASNDAEDFVHIDIKHSPGRPPSPASFDTEAMPQPGAVATSDTVSTISNPGARSTHEADEPQLVPRDMQLIHIPRQPRSRLSRLARAEADQVRRGRPQSPPAPPPGLFEPSGIAYLNREWVQLSGAPLASPPSDAFEPGTRPHSSYYSSPPPIPSRVIFRRDSPYSSGSPPSIGRYGSRRRADSYPASDDESNATAEHETPQKTHNPFDLIASKDDSESRKFPGSHLFPCFTEMKSNISSEESSARAEWERQKRELKEKNDALDQLMAMVGLEEVKTEFLKVKATINEARKRKGWLKRQDLNLVLMGNPGTGMTRSIYLHKRGVGA